MTWLGRGLNAGEFKRITGGIGGDERYWAALADGEFRLCQCAQCKKWIWPAHYRCGDCGSWDMDWPTVEPKGVIYSWTRTWYAFDRTPERHEDVPYVSVLAEIPHAGKVRVMGMLAGDEQGLAIGAAVRGTILPPSVKAKGYPSICWEIVR